MNLRLAFAAVLAATSLVHAAAAADDGAATIRFSNNDQLMGSLESISTDRLVWKSPVLEKPAPFLLSDVVDVAMPGRIAQTAAGHEATVTLTNGDLVRGQIATVTDDGVELDTWFAGRLKLNRLMISDIKIAELPDSIYRGPSGLEGWTQTDDKPVWSFQGVGFRSSGAGGIARDVKLPDECSVAFDVAWRSVLNLKLIIFSADVTTDDPDSGYEITFQPRLIQMRDGKTKKSMQYSRKGAMLQELDKARIEVRASRKSGKICVFINDEILEVWNEPTLMQGDPGSAIHFVAKGTAPMQISRIEVTSWDGEIEKMPEPEIGGGMPGFGIGGINNNNDEEEEETPPPAGAEGAPGRMELRNGDSLAGEVVGIAEGVITVKTPFREVKLPIERLRSLALKPTSPERCKRYNGDVRGWFPDGTSLVFRLDATSPDSLTGYSQNFGKATFKLSAFSRIEFNIYSPKLDSMRSVSGW